MSFSRRKILKSSLVVAALQLLGLSAGNLRPSLATAPQGLAERLVKLHGAQSSAQAVGRAYLSLVPAESDPSTLLALICSPGPENRDGTADLDGEGLRDRLMCQHKRDFLEGRTIRIRGWVLSRTEARLCALTTVMS